MAFLRSTRVRESFDALTASQVVEPGDTPVAGVLGVDGTLYTDEFFVTREVAMSVPAYKRAWTLITASLSQMPLGLYRESSRLATPPFLRRMDSERIQAAFLADIIGDLCHHGVAYARVTARDDDGMVASVQYLPVEDVLEVTETSYRILVREPGDPEVHEALLAAREVLGFECSAGTWLKHGARVITTARMLEEAARLYASSPVPLTLLKNSGPRKTPEQVAELLDAIGDARRARSTAYVGRDLELEHMGWDANQIALGEARAHSVLDVARVTGVPSIYLSQGPNEAAMMYSNQTQARLDLHSAMTPYATAVAQRLSMDDCTYGGNRVEFEFAEWLRVDPTMRANLYAQMIPLGVLTVQEARRMENLNGEGNPQ